MKKTALLLIIVVLAMICASASASSDFQIRELQNQTAEITGYLGDADILSIPEQIDGLTVTGISGSAFERNKKIKSVVIPDTVLTIGDYAFMYCENLESITMSDGLQSIGKYAFYGAYAESIEIPDSVEYIGSAAFGGCSRMISVKLPRNLNNIGTNPFEDCTSLQTLIMPESNVRFRVEDGVLYGGRALICYPAGLTDKTFTIPSRVERIFNYSFSGCMLEEVIIPWGVENIGAGAFASCENLKTVNIPSSVESIEAFTFMNCNNLESILIPGSITSIDDTAFMNTENVTVIVYEHTYAQRIVEEKGLDYTVITVDGTPVGETPKGITFETIQLAAETDGIQAGDYVYFGRYPQKNISADPTPIEWLVLDVQDGKALVISRYLLEKKEYNPGWGSVTWEDSAIREWLNSEFLNTAFSQEEQKAIL